MTDLERETAINASYELMLAAWYAGDRDEAHKQWLVMKRLHGERSTEIVGGMEQSMGLK